MNNKKYEILMDEKNTIEWQGRTLHRIRALKNFGDVKKDDLGGYIEDENNLSQKGNCWNPFSIPYKLYQQGNKDKAIELLEDLAKNILFSPKYFIKSSSRSIKSIPSSAISTPIKLSL